MQAIKRWNLKNGVTATLEINPDNQLILVVMRNTGPGLAYSRTYGIIGEPNPSLFDKGKLRFVRSRSKRIGKDYILCRVKRHDKLCDVTPFLERLAAKVDQTVLALS